MIPKSLKDRYGIRATYNMVSAVDDLFSGSEHDPYLNALEHGSDIAGANEGFDIVIAVGPPKRVWNSDSEIDGTNEICVITTQLIMFATKGGVRRYKNDNVLIFEDKGI